MQFANQDNPAAHRQSTGPEIWKALDGQVDAFVAGVGTGGTLTGVGQYLRRKHPAVKLIAVEPGASPVLGGGQAGAHRIFGIGAGFVPPVLDRSLIDRVVEVSDAQAELAAGQLARKEGLLSGVSAGANAHAAAEVAASLAPSAKVVTVLCDGGALYLDEQGGFA
jgi:cysteine synthase A